MINSGEGGFFRINEDRVSMCPGFLFQVTCESRRIQSNLKADGEGEWELISQLLVTNYTVTPLATVLTAKLWERTCVRCFRRSLGVVMNKH